MSSVIERLKQIDPDVPEQLHDRAKDNAEPLAAIAELAGGSWPRRFRKAILTLTKSVDEVDNSATIQLLGDLRAFFDSEDTDRLGSDDIVQKLASMEDRPWPEWKHEKPITVRQLAVLLRPFDIRPKPLWIDDRTTQGYERDQFQDAFSRYTPSPDPQDPQDSTKHGTSGGFFDPQDRDDSWGSQNRANARNQGGLGDLGDLQGGYGKTNVEMLKKRCRERKSKSRMEVEE